MNQKYEPPETVNPPERMSGCEAILLGILIFLITSYLCGFIFIKSWFE